MSKQIIRLVIIATVGISLFSFSHLNAQSDQGPGSPIPGKFLVKFKPGVRISSVASSLSQGQRLRRLSQLETAPELKGAEEWQRWHLFVTDKTDMTVDDVLKVVGEDNVEHIEQDRYLIFFDYPTDSLFSDEWFLNNTGQLYLGIDRIDGSHNDQLIMKQGTAGVDIGRSFLYEDPPAETTRVVVAIVDSGNDLVHPEMRDRLWHNPDEIPGNNIDDDHNGFVDDTVGYDISGDTLALYQPEGDADPTDEIGHGTHIAGIVAASANGIGVVGIAPTAEIMSVKIRPNGTNAVGAAGVLYAVASGAQIINVSWGTPFQSFLLKDAFDIARQNGVMVAMAAGNTGDNTRLYPAAFESSFAVAAGNSDGFLTTFSTWGPMIDVVAPGLDILSLRARGTDMYAAAGEPGVRIIGDDSLYYLSDGTSMAAPMVCGAAALMLTVRPDLNLDELESILRTGARDIIDPFDKGDNYPGPDTISGWGYLDIEGSLSLLTEGSIFVVEPWRGSRFVNGADVKIAPVAGYTGGWTLDYSLRPDEDPWMTLASGSFPPPDSVAYVFGPGDPSGLIHLRLTDDFGSTQYTSFVFVNEDRVEIVSPTDGEEYNFSIPIRLNLYGGDLDSARISYQDGGVEPTVLYRTTSEYFDSLAFTWNASGLPLGPYSVIVTGYFSNGEVSDTVDIVINSAFASGWPQTLTGRGTYSPAVGDLDKDGTKEIVVGTSFGLNVFHGDGTIAEGFPVLDTFDCRSVPAIYDIDGDGLDEILFTCELGIFAYNYDGSATRGWPRLWIGTQWKNSALAYGYPQPVVTELGVYEDSAVACILSDGTVMAYDFDGESYFKSLMGKFTKFKPSSTQAYVFGGNAVSSTDLIGDGQQEVVVTYSSSTPVSGVAIFEGRTGEPAFDRPEPYVITCNGAYGTVLADLTGDGLPEIITVGFDETTNRRIWVNTRGTATLPGWPVTVPGVASYRGSYPTVGDLDLDGIPEILVTFFEFNTASLYAYKADGSPYLTIDTLPAGCIYRVSQTFGSPIVANLTGDEFPEIIIRSGFIFPGTGPELVHILDHLGKPISGSPLRTPAPTTQVFSTIYAPLVDDTDNDGLVELVLVGEANEVYIWDFDAPSNHGRNTGRLFMDNSNTSIYGDNHSTTDVPDSQDRLPLSFQLEQNFPNPFNPSTKIRFTLKARDHVKLDVFNVLGQQVVRLVDDEMQVGSYTVEFDGSRLASGAYFYRLEVGGERITKKMVLLK